MHERTIDNYISHYQNYFPEQFCDKWIEYFKNVQWGSHKWGNNIGEVGFSLHNNEPKIYFLNDEPQEIDFRNIIYNNLKNCVNNYELDIGQNTFVANISKLRLNKYEKNATMLPHVDHIYDIFDGNIKGIPVVSFIVNLNDDYEGGELIFSKEIKINLKKGDVVIFPSNFMYPHEISAVTAGTRYSIVGWGY